MKRVSQRSVGSAVMVLAAGAGLALAQPPSIPIPQPKPMPEQPAGPPPPAFAEVPPEVQTGARGFDPRLTEFEVTEKRQLGGAIFYMITGRGSGVQAEMRVIQSGTVMSVRTTEEDTAAPPPELLEAITARFGKEAPIVQTRRISVYFVEPQAWIRTQEGDQGEVRKTFLNSTIGAAFYVAGPDTPVPPDAHDAPSADDASASAREFARLPAPVQKSVMARDPNFTRFSVTDLTIEGTPVWEVKAASPMLESTLTVAPGGTIVNDESVSRTISVTPPEFAAITAQLFPKATVLSKRQRLVRSSDTGVVFKASGGTRQAILRRTGKMEFATDNPLPPAKPGAGPGPTR